MGINVVTETGVGGAAQYTRRAASRFRDWMRLKTDAQKQKASKAGIQIGASAVFGLLLLVWAEIALYFGLAGTMSRGLAALLVFVFNGIVIAGVNLYLMRAKRRIGSDIAAERRREQAIEDLSLARQELRQTTSAFMHDRVVVPFNRYKMPVAVVGTFTVGFVLARALFPKERVAEGDMLVIERNVPTTADIPALY